jgi:hypothetical protein
MPSRIFETSVRDRRLCLWYSAAQKQKVFRMNPIDLIVTVCAVLSPATCEETHLTFSGAASLRQCAMGAPPYIAQWVGEHPKWNAVRWRCEYLHTHDKAEAVE